MDMKKYSIVFSALALAAVFGVAKAEDNANTNGATCPVVSAEDKIEKKVDAAKIDYSLNPGGFREKLIKEIVGTFGQENLDKIGYFVYTMLPDGVEKVTDRVEVVTVADLKERITLNGSYVMTDRELAKKFGAYFFQAKARNPQIIGAIQRVKSNFKPEDLGVSFYNKFIQLDDGRMIVLLSGCTPHNCGGTENMVAYDFAGGQAYVLEENSDSTKAYIFGNPDAGIRNILLYEYLYH